MWWVWPTTREAREVAELSLSDLSFFQVAEVAHRVTSPFSSCTVEQWA